MTTTPVRLGEYVPTSDRRITLYGKTWADFEAVLAVRGDRSSPRMTYLDGAIELVSPSRDHEGIKSLIGGLVEAYCRHKKILVRPDGSWLLRERPNEAAVEPDESYCFGPNPKAKDHPDLVIEVIWTSGGIDKLEAYRRLEVGEVWFWEEEVLSVYTLDGERYVLQERSRCLPELDLALISKLAMLDTLTEALDAFLATLGS